MPRGQRVQRHVGDVRARWIAALERRHRRGAYRRYRTARFAGRRARPCCRSSARDPGHALALERAPRSASPPRTRRARPVPRPMPPRRLRSRARRKSASSPARTGRSGGSSAQRRRVEREDRCRARAVARVKLDLEAPGPSALPVLDEEAGLATTGSSPAAYVPPRTSSMSSFSRAPDRPSYVVPQVDDDVEDRSAARPRGASASRGALPAPRSSPMWCKASSTEKSLLRVPARAVVRVHRERLVEQGAAPQRHRPAEKRVRSRASPGSKTPRPRRRRPLDETPGHLEDGALARADSARPSLARCAASGLAAWRTCVRSPWRSASMKWRACIEHADDDVDQAEAEPTTVCSASIRRRGPRGSRRRARDPQAPRPMRRERQRRCTSSH